MKWLWDALAATFVVAFTYGASRWWLRREFKNLSRDRHRVMAAIELPFVLAATIAFAYGLWFLGGVVLILTAIGIVALGYRYEQKDKDYRWFR